MLHMKLPGLSRSTHRRTLSEEAVLAYTRDVVAALARVFDDIRTDEITARVVRDAVARYLSTGPSGTADAAATTASMFEVIVDSPLAANWRLRVDRDNYWVFHVSDCRLFGTSVRPEIETLNRDLAALGAAHQPL